LKIPMEQRGIGREHILALMERIIKGDIDAFEKILELYQKRLFKIAFRMVGSLEDARDILQEAFMKIFKNIRKLKAVREPYPYFCQITINVCRDWLKKEKRNHIPLAENSNFSKDGERGSYSNPEFLIYQRERGKILMESLDNLTDRERTAICLRDLEELKTKEVALILGCSQATVRSHIASARVKIKDYLSANYPELKGEANEV